MKRQEPSVGLPEDRAVGAGTGRGVSSSFLSEGDLAKLAVVGIAYFVLALVGLQLASIHPSATPVWAPSGLAIAAILSWGYRVAPAVFVAAFLVNALFTGTTLTSLVIACGNTLEAAAAVYLIHSFIGMSDVFETPSNVAKFFSACLVATTISASTGVSSLILGGHAEAAAFLPIWLTWWLGDLAGALIVAPVVLLWVDDGLALATPDQIYRTTATYGASAAVAFICFSPFLRESAFRDVLAFFVVLPLLWAAIRQSPRDTATVALIISVFAVWGTLYHGGPFTKSSLNGALIVLLVFLISLVVPALALSAEVSTRRRLETKQRRQSLEAEILWQASVQVASGGSFVELLRTCLQKICEVTGWTAGHVYLPDNINDPHYLRSSGVWHFERKALVPLAREAMGLGLRRGQGLPGQIWATGKPIWISDLQECNILRRRDFLLRHGLRTAFGFPIFIEGKLQAVLEFFSTARRRPDEDLMRIVQSIGEQLGRVIERKHAEEQRTALETTLNALTLAVYFTDRAARVVYMNRAAEQQLNNGSGLRLEDDRLVPADHTARAELTKAIDLATANATNRPFNATIIPCPDAGGVGLIAVILPLQEGKVFCRPSTATAAVLVQDSVMQHPLPMGEAFAHLYGLTKGELRVLLAMSLDLSVKQAAERLGISETTAKTHLKHIYAKTNTSRQSELIHLFMRFTPPLDSVMQPTSGSPSAGVPEDQGSESQ